MKSYWINNIHCIYFTYNRAFASTVDFEFNKKNLIGSKVFQMKYDHQKHVIWDPSLARKSESNLSKFTSKFFKAGDVEI
jgi:hypothetical protein